MRIIGKSKKRFLDKDMSEILGAEFVSMTGGILGGLILTNLIDKIYLIPGLLILIPGFLETHGNILGSLSARISAALHLKKIKAKDEHSAFIRANTYASIIEAIALGLILGLVAYLITYFLFNISNTNLIFISLLAIIISIIIEIPITTATSFWLFKHGYDPDDIMGPYVTTLGDIISIVCLLIAVSVLI